MPELDQDFRALGLLGKHKDGPIPIARNLIERVFR